MAIVPRLESLTPQNTYSPNVLHCRQSATPLMSFVARGKQISSVDKRNRVWPAWRSSYRDTSSIRSFCRVSGAPSRRRAPTSTCVRCALARARPKRAMRASRYPPRAQQLLDNLIPELQRLGAGLAEEENAMTAPVTQSGVLTRRLLLDQQSAHPGTHRRRVAACGEHRDGCRHRGR